MTMLSLDVYSASFRKPAVERTALHRLFAAAIVSDQFRKTLLREPEKALANGYLGQTFPLTDQEKKIIKTIRAENLSDFAQKVNQALKTICELHIASVIFYLLCRTDVTPGDAAELGTQ